MSYSKHRVAGEDCETTVREMMKPFEESSILNEQHSQGICGTPRPFWGSNP